MLKLKALLIKFEAVIIAFMVALILGISTGWVIKSKFVNAELAEKMTKIEKLSKLSIEESNRLEEMIATRKDSVEIRYVTKFKEVVKYVPKTITKTCQLSDGTSVDTVLSVDAVRVLSDSGQSTDVQPTNDEQGKSLTEVGLRELSEYVVTIKKQYEDLAIEHDGLIDYNAHYKKLINQQ